MLDFKKIIIREKCKVIDALNVIEKGGFQIALVLNKDDKLIGMLSDGDIRRGLLKGKNLDTEVTEIMNRDFLSINSFSNKRKLIDLMQSKGIRQLPVLDETGHVNDLLFLDSLLNLNKLSNSVVIMAGGKGKRLRPHTENCPKPMLQVSGKPMLEIVLENCISNGFKDFYISVNYQKEKIINYFQDGKNFGASIKYLIENEPLGTAGSLDLLPVKMKEPFLVINADVLTRFNLSNILRFHNENKGIATVGVRKYEVNIPLGVISAKGIELDSFHEKPTFSYMVNTGIYVMNPIALEYVPDKKFTDMPELLEKIKLKNKKVIVCPIHEYWLDVGRPETLEKAKSDGVFN